jgi:hypothetical protein
MKISVTQEHINNGLPRSPFCCPIALACEEAGIEGPGVDNRYIDGIDFHAALPPAASEFIENFDALRTVAPFEFEIDPGSTLDDEDDDELGEDY